MKSKEEMEKFISGARLIQNDDKVKPEGLKNALKEALDELESAIKQLNEGYRPVQPR